MTNGDKFDSNENKDDPFKFTIGVGQVIKGIELQIIKINCIFNELYDNYPLLINTFIISLFKKNFLIYSFFFFF